MPHEPNRALARQKLEALAWQKTPADYRGSSGIRREVLLNTTDGTTLVPLGEMTDYQLRRYIGPSALEEAGDMRKNGSEARTEAMLQKLRSSGRLHVEDKASGVKPFWILQKSWAGGAPYGYSASTDGKRPAGKYEILSADQLWQWLSHLEEAGDMRKNGGDEEERFLEALKTSLDIGDRQIFFELSKRSLRVYVQFYNVPQGIASGAARENNRLMLIAEGSPNSDKIRVELTVRGPAFGETYKLRAKTASPEKAAEYVADFLNRAAKKAPYGHDFANYDKNPSRRREEADETAARELSLYIENEYSLVGAPNSQGKAIEKNLLRKIKSGTFDFALSEKAWMYLMETGAKKYCKENADSSDWSRIFNKPTRELVAHEFATTFAEEHGAKSLARNPQIEIEEFDAPAHWASAFINGDTSGLEEEDLAEFEAWQAKHPELGWVVDVSEETHVGRWNGLQTELATYTAHVQEGS